MRLEPPLPFRIMSDLLTRLSRSRLERGEEPLPEEQLRIAAEHGPDELERVALAYALRLGSPRHTLATMARLSGLPPDQMASLWLALGFAQPDRKDPIFTDGDLTAFNEFRRVLSDEDLDPGDALQLARVVGQSFGRLSDALVGILEQRVGQRLRGDGGGDSEVAVALAASPALGTIDELLTYAWKRHLAAAIRRAALSSAASTDQPAVCIGFADVVGYTRLTARLDGPQLAHLLGCFHTAADEAVVQGGGRIVKTLGDEIMFVANSPEVGIDIALRLAAGFQDGREHIDLHVGLAWGAVVRRDGDYYGKTVNIASRIADAAPPASVLVDTGLYQTLQARDRLTALHFSPATTPDLPPIEAWVVSHT